MRIQNNILAKNSYRNYSKNTSALDKSLEKLSSGYRINRAADDAAGLAISEKMRAQISGLNAAQGNAINGSRLVQTADGAMQELQVMLNRGIHLATQSSNGTYDNETDRAALNVEWEKLSAEIDRISNSSNYNGINLLDGTLAAETRSGTAWTIDHPFTAPSGGYPSGHIGLSLTLKGDISITGYSVSGTHPEGTPGYAVVCGDGDAKGWISLCLQKGISYSSDDIKALLAKATLNDDNLQPIPNPTAEQLALLASAKNVTVSGTGVDASVGKGITTAHMNFTSYPFTDTSGGLVLQIGEGSEDYNQMRIDIPDVRSKALGLTNVSVSHLTSAQSAIAEIKQALNYISGVRGNMGAYQNRLDHTLDNLSIMEEHIQSAESSIRDADLADEMTAYTKSNILIQSAQAMLAQANTLPQGVLQLMQ